MAEDRYSYTVEEFCEVERMSRSMLYKLWKEGKGPKFYWVGTVRRISHEARIEWQRQLEAINTENPKYNVRRHRNSYPVQLVELNATSNGGA